MRKLLRSKKFWMILVIAGILLYAGNRYVKAQKIRQYLEECDRKAEKYRKNYGSVMQKKFAAYFPEDFEYVKDIRVSASSVLISTPIWSHCWQDSVVVTIYAEDAFDQLMDNTQYEYLCQFEEKGSSAISENVRQHMEGYQEARREFTYASYQYQGIHYQVDEDYHFIVKTSENTYEYAHNVRDYFLLNGRDHYTQKFREKYRKEQEKKNPRKEKNTYLPSGKFDYGDPYNVQEYDDPEDFYEDHEDEFEDYEEADDYYDEHHG